MAKRTKEIRTLQAPLSRGARFSALFQLSRVKKRRFGA